MSDIIKKEEFIKLTEIQSGLLEELANIEKEVFGEAGFNRYSIPFIISWGRYFIYKSEGDIVAGAQVIRSYDDRSDLYLAGLWVKKEFRSKGIGKRFLGKIIGQLFAGGGKRLYLTVDPKNENAVSFYKKFGFKTVSLEKDYYGKGEERLLMVLSL